MDEEPTKYDIFPEGMLTPNDLIKKNRLIEISKEPSSKGTLPVAIAYLLRDAVKTYETNEQALAFTKALNICLGTCFVNQNHLPVPKAKEDTFAEEVFINLFKHQTLSPENKAIWVHAMPGLKINRI